MIPTSSLASCAALVLPHVAAPPATPVVWTFVHVRTDLNEFVPGAAVSFEIPGIPSPIGRTTDANGMTRRVGAGDGDAVTVTIGEARTVRGSTIGQKLDLVVSAPGGIETILGYARFVPEARTIHFGHEAGFVYDEHSLQWYATPFGSGAEFSFDAGVGALRDAQAIEAYLRYQGLTASQSWVQGVLLRSATDIELGSASLWLGVLIQEYSYDALAVDVLQVTQEPVAPTVQAELLLEDGVHAGIRLGGTLLEGDTLILLREGGGGSGSSAQPGAPPDLPLPPPGGGMSSPPDLRSGSERAQRSSERGAAGSTLVAAPGVAPAAGIAQPQSGEAFRPCDPPEPDAATYCPVPGTTSIDTQPPENDCGASPVSIVGGDGESRLLPAWGSGPPPCTPKGLSQENQICWIYEGGLSLEFQFKVGPVEIVVGPNGKVSYQWCKTVIFAECTCVGTWICEWSDVARWRVCLRYHTLEGIIEVWRNRFLYLAGSEAIEQATTCTPTGSGC